MKSNTRTERILLRITEKDKAAIAERAEQAGLSVSEFVRRTALKSRVVIRQSRHDVELVKELNAIGNNLNQLVQKCHTTGNVDVDRLGEILLLIEDQLLMVMDDPED